MPPMQLHVEVPHVDDAASGFADDRERFRQEVVERFAARGALAQRRRAGLQVHVGQIANARLELVDARDRRAQPFQLTFVLRADDFGEEGVEHLTTAGSAARTTWAR